MRFPLRQLIAILILLPITAGCGPTSFSQNLPMISSIDATSTQPPPTGAPVATMTSLTTSSPTPQPSPTFTDTPSPAPTVEVVTLSGAGDIAVCGTSGSAKTAALLAQIPGDIFTAGDNSNEDGSMQQYTDCFGPTWGQFLARIHPAVGNHDYMTAGAADYYAYFGAAAGEVGKGYYSYEEGAWHVVVLNSNCNDVGCGAESDQVQWLKADLAAHPTQCSLAYWHHPRFSSGISGSSGMYPFWQVLYDYGVELVVNGNDHDYERFAPQDPLGKADPEKGIREFVVGTGGASQRAFKDIVPNSEVHQTGTYGVLKLTLYPDRYDWEFVPVEGGNFQDSGSGACH
jgi:acid phosphatase type 7